MTKRHILYSFRRCPYAMRARMAITVSGISVELREVVLRDKPDEMLEASPKGTVPVLVLTDGRVIDESLSIMRWALDLNTPQNWLAGDDPALITLNDGPFKTALDRYKYPHRYEIIDTAADRLEATKFLSDLDARLTSHIHLADNTPGFTDIAIFPFVRQFVATDQSWFGAQPWPRLQRWLDAHVRSPLFETIMQRYPQWRTGDAPTFFPI
ncbi:MAG: glutathione S-transferase [Pseudomonadota bacterium]